MDGRIDEWMDGRGGVTSIPPPGWMDACMDGWMDGQKLVLVDLLEKFV